MTGPELHALRLHAGLTQAQLGALIHRDHNTISRWELGVVRIVPPLDDVIRRALAHAEAKIPPS